MTYAEIRALQAQANPWMQSLSTEDFSRVMGQLTGNPTQFESGVDPSWLAQADYQVNRLIGATGLPEASGQLGESLFGETGRQVFTGVPRAFVNMAPLAIPGAGWAHAAKLGATAALTGAETWGATEKVLPTTLAAGFAAAVPSIMGKAGRTAIQAMKGPQDAIQANLLRTMIAEGGEGAAARMGGNLAAHTTAATTTGQMLAGLAAGQAALTGVQTGIEAINIGADEDRSFKELLAPEYWAATALSQGLFAGLDVARIPSLNRQAGRMRGMLTSGDTRMIAGPASPLWEPNAGPVYGPPDRPASPTLLQPGPIGWPSTVEASREAFLRSQSPEQATTLYDPATFASQYVNDVMQNTRPEGGAITDAGLSQVPLTSQEWGRARGWLVPKSDAFDLPPTTMPSMAPDPKAPIVMDLVGPRSRGTLKEPELLAKIDSDLPVDWAEAISDGAPDDFRLTLARIVDRKVRDGMSPDEAQMDALNLGREHFRTALRKSAEPERKMAWVNEKNANTLSERAELAKTDPKVKAELDLVNKASAMFARLDKNMGDVRVDPIFSAYRNWLEDGSPGGKLGLERKLTKAARTNAQVKLKLGQVAPTLGISPEMEVALKAVESGDDGMLADVVADENIALAKSEVDATSQSLKKAFGLAMRDPGVTGELFHGGAQGIRQFDKRKIVRKGFGVGLHMARARKMAEGYAYQVRGGGSVYTVDPALKNPASMDLYAKYNFWNKFDDEKTTNQLIAEGYDGLVYKEFTPRADEDGTVYVAFDPSKVQIVREARMGEEMAQLVGNPTEESVARLNQLSLDRANATPDERIGRAGDFFGKVMRSMGMSEQEVAQRLPGIARLYTAVKELRGTDLAQLSQKGRQAYGFFVAGDHPLVLLGADPKSADLLGYTLAHELIGHGLWDAHVRGVLPTKTSMQLDRTRKFVESALPEDRAKMLGWMTEGLPSKVLKSPQLRAILDSAATLSSPDEVMAHMNAIAAMHMVEGRPSNLRGLVRYLPKPISDFLVNAADWVSRSVRTLKMAFRGDKEMWNVLQGHENAMRDVMRAGRENEADALRLEAFARMTEPGGLLAVAKDYASADDWFSTVFDTSEMDAFGTGVARAMSGPLLKEIVAEGKAVGGGLGRLGSALARTLVHTFRSIPQIGASIKTLRWASDITGQRERRQARLLKGFADVMSGKHWGAHVQFDENSPMQKLYSSGNRDAIDAKNDLFRWVNENDMSKTVAEHIEQQTPAVMEIFNRIPEEHRNTIKALASQMDVMARKSNEAIHELVLDHTAARTAAASLFQVPGQDHGLSYQPVREFFGRYADKLKAGEAIDYNQMTSEAVPLLTGSGDPSVGLQRATRSVEVFRLMAEMENENVARRAATIGFISERRLGPIRITYVKDGVTDLLTAHTKTDAEQLMAKLRRDGATDVAIQEGQGIRDFEPGDVGGVDRAIEQTLAKQREKLLLMGLDEAEVNEILSVVDIRPELATIESLRDVASLNVKRQFKPGRKYLDMTEQQWNWSRALVRQKSMAIAASEIRGLQNDSQLSKLPEARSIVTAFANYRTPDTPSMRAISKFSYFMTLAGNTANYMQEMAQTAVAFPWKLVDEGAGIVEANRFVGNAYRQFAKVWASKKYLRDGQFDLSKLSKDHQAVLTEAINNRTLEASGFTEFEEGAVTDLFRKGAVTMGQLEPKTAEPISEAAQKAGQLAIRVHNKFTSLSTGVALLSAYDFLRSRGRSHADAMREVYPLVNEGMLRAGREGRAAGIYDVGSARPVASMMMSLQGFALGTLTQMATYLSRAVRPGMGKVERLNAARAAVGMIVTNVALAGVMGLPGVGAGLRILQQATGLDLEKLVEQQSELEEDPGVAPLLKAASLRGFSHILGGPDVSQKYGISSVLGFNEYDGFNLANLFGPVGSYVKRVPEAVGQLAGGNVGSAAEAVSPVALRKFLQLWNDDWQFRSPENDEILMKNPTFGEKLGFALGWQPVKLNRLRQAWAMQRRAHEAKYAKDDRDFDEMAVDFNEGRVTDVVSNLQSRAQAEGPDYDHRATVQKIAARVEQRKFARDPGRTGTQSTSSEDEAVLRSLGVSVPTQEAERATLRDQVMQALGARGYDYRDMETYRQIDVLRKRNPFLTVAQAKALLRRHAGFQQQAIPTALQALMHGQE